MAHAACAAQIIATISRSPTTITIAARRRGESMSSNADARTTAVCPPRVPTPHTPAPALGPVLTHRALGLVRSPSRFRGTETESLVTIAQAARLAGAGAAGRIISVPVSVSVLVLVLVPVRVVIAPEVSPVSGGDEVALGLRLSDMRLANLTLRVNEQGESAIIRRFCVSEKHLMVVLAARAAFLGLDRFSCARVC